MNLLPESLQLVLEDVHWKLLWLVPDCCQNCCSLMIEINDQETSNKIPSCLEIYSVQQDCFSLLCLSVRNLTEKLAQLGNSFGSHLYIVRGLYHLNFWVKFWVPSIILITIWWRANKPHSRASLTKPSVLQWRLPQKVGPLVSGRFKKKEGPS